jgi:PPE-repeat protein
VPPETDKNLTPQQRFNNSWDELLARKADKTSQYDNNTGIRVVRITDGDNESLYGLSFELGGDTMKGRSIRATWQHFRSTIDGVTQESYYQYVELFNEDWIASNQYSDRLANIQTSVEAFMSVEQQTAEA